ncbi:hypothetical protein BVI1335_1070007 [Burkholderia vietnamiensis]|nr:hypothetical protein BVI1335_1070007 [Burkholderia vietnamiensis]
MEHAGMVGALLASMVLLALLVSPGVVIGAVGAVGALTAAAQRCGRAASAAGSTMFIR